MNLLRFIVYSNILVSFAAASISYSFCHLQEIENKNWYSLFVFFSTLLTYNAQRIIKRRQDQKDWSTGRLLWIKKNSILLYTFSIISATCTSWIYFKYLYQLHSFIFLIPLALISIFYALKLGNLKNLREIPHLKIHLIAFVWVASTVLFPAINEEITNSFTLYFSAAFYLYILAITVPFDIRDLNFDNPGNKTVPQVFGISIAKKIALITLLASLIIFFYILPDIQKAIALTFALLIPAILIQQTDIKKPEMYFSGLIDGAIILLSLSLIV